MSTSTLDIRRAPSTETTDDELTEELEQLTEQCSIADAVIPACGTE